MHWFLHSIDTLFFNRKFSTRSVSLKAPTSYLPPLDDAEQITMDIESYRQVMKDVMIVKTVLHQLDRLLKHSDGANMTVRLNRKKTKINFRFLRIQWSVHFMNIMKIFSINDDFRLVQMTVIFEVQSMKIHHTMICSK